VRHPDPDDLALFAAGGGHGLNEMPGLPVHLAECPVCRAEVEAFRYTAELIRDNDARDALPAPGPHVWDAIAAELGFADGGRADADAAERSTVTRDAGKPGSADNSALRSVAVTSGGAPVDLAERRRRRSRWMPAAAALVVGAALGAGAIAITDRSEQPDPTQIEATAPLGPVPGGPLTDPTGTLGRAELVTVDGAQRVVVNTDRLPAIPGAYEVWLFGADGKMVALGSLQAGRGEFTVPQGIDTSEYRTVDISDEPADGVPTHSGISVVRGTFS
jgi:hypothetical protein